MYNLISQRINFVYKYMIAFMFLQISIFSNIHYNISDRTLKYYKYIYISALFIIIYLCKIKDFTSAILLTVTLLLFNNILNLKEYLRENFFFNK
jgi:hypothetical protein